MPLTWLSKNNIIWINSTIHSLLISLTILLLINQFSDNSLKFSLVFFSDSLSTPLLILTIWLLLLMLIASQHHLSKENLTRKKKKNYYYINLITTILNHKLHCYRTNLLLHPIWSNTSPNTHYYYPVRKTNRTPKRQLLLLVLYTSRLLTATSCTSLYPKHGRISKLPNALILSTTNA